MKRSLRQIEGRLWQSRGRRQRSEDRRQIDGRQEQSQRDRVTARKRDARADWALRWEREATAALRPPDSGPWAGRQ
jgi:hypothetical protein